MEEKLSKTIGVRDSTKEKMDNLKVHPRESYDDLINRLILYRNSNGDLEE